jgi:hypothetical protein
MTFKAVFPDILARYRYPAALKAVSGCNILILPLDASLLRPYEALR